MKSGVHFGKKFRQVLACLMVGSMITGTAFSGYPAAYAFEQKEEALFSIDGNNLLEALRDAEDYGMIFEYGSLYLQAKNNGIQKQYKTLFRDVYRLDPDILNIDDACAPRDTAVDVFYRADSGAVIFLFENKSEMKVSFRVEVDGYQTAPVMVKPNSCYLDEEDSDFGINYGSEDETEYSVATASDADRFVSVATASDADRSVSAATDSNANRYWKEMLKDDDEHWLEDDLKGISDTLEGIEYELVTIGDHVNAKALVVSADLLSFLADGKMRTVSGDGAVYLQPSEKAHQHHLGDMDDSAETLKEAYQLAKLSGDGRIYICSAYTITDEDQDYLNDSEITFVRCPENTSDYLMKVETGQVEMSQTEIDGDHVNSRVSLIYVGAGAELTISGSTWIRNGVTDHNGGAILVDGGTLYMTGGVLSENQANYADDYSGGCGGAVYVQSNGRAEFDGGILKSNTAESMGGAVCVERSVVNFGTNQGSTTVVTENNSGTEGSGICYTEKSSGEIYRAEFTNNHSTDYLPYPSGAISVQQGNRLQMKNVYVAENVSTYESSWLEALDPTYVRRDGALYCCPTSQLAISMVDGALFVDNENVADICYTGTPQAFVSNTALGGGKITYYNYPSGDLMDPEDYQYSNGGDTGFMISASVSAQTKELARQNAEVIITGNTGYGEGCAIANNGTLIIGTDTKALKVTKEWEDEKGNPLTDHPDEVKIYLAANGQKLDPDTRDDAVVTLNAENNWSYTWSDLGYHTTWTVMEDDMDGFSHRISEPKPAAGFDLFPNSFYVTKIVNYVDPEATAPETKPSDPETKPSDPETTPDDPETTPDDPETTPTTSETKPGETKPETSVPETSASVQETSRPSSSGSSGASGSSSSSGSSGSSSSSRSRWTSSETMVTIDDEAVPEGASSFEIEEAEVPIGTFLPKTGDTSIPFVLLALLMVCSSAGMIILIRKIRQSEE
jgi:LPXTG-motif cell wall-anchored protein